MARTRHVESECELEELIDEFLTKGYKIQKQSRHSAKVKEKDWGSAPIHGFVFLFTFVGSAVLLDVAGVSAGGVWVVTILANITYAMYSWFTAEEIIIKVDGNDYDG